MGTTSKSHSQTQKMREMTQMHGHKLSFGHVSSRLLFGCLIGTFRRAKGRAKAFGVSHHSRSFLGKQFLSRFLPQPRHFPPQVLGVLLVGCSTSHWPYLELET